MADRIVHSSWLQPGVVFPSFRLGLNLAAETAGAGAGPFAMYSKVQAGQRRREVRGQRGGESAGRLADGPGRSGAGDRPEVILRHCADNIPGRELVGP